MLVCFIRRSTTHFLRHVFVFRQVIEQSESLRLEGVGLRNIGSGELRFGSWVGSSVVSMVGSDSGL